MFAAASRSLVLSSSPGADHVGRGSSRAARVFGRAARAHARRAARGGGGHPEKDAGAGPAREAGAGTDRVAAGGYCWWWRCGGSKELRRRRCSGWDTLIIAYSSEVTVKYAAMLNIRHTCSNWPKARAPAYFASPRRTGGASRRNRRIRERVTSPPHSCDKDSSDRCRGDVFPSGSSGCRRTSVRPPAARLVRNDCSPRDTRSRGCTAKLRHNRQGGRGQESEHIRSCTLSHQDRLEIGGIVQRPP
jgi:hypothetical protein